MRKKLPVLLLVLIILLQAFVPVAYAASKNEGQFQTAYFCPSDATSKGAGKTVNNAIEVKDGVRYINGNKAIINAEKQARHLPDTVQGTRSYLTTDAQKLLNKVGGTGDFVQPYKEVVNVGSNVGKYVDQVTGVAVDTTRVTIHYSKTGVHIVPAPPLR